MSNKGNMKVVVVQTIVPKYRVRFFEELVKNPIFDWVIAFGKERKGSVLRSCLDEGSFAKKILRNIYVPMGGVYWQRGIVLSKSFWQCDVIILEQNPRCLSSLVLLALGKILRKRIIWWGHGLSNHPNRINTLIRVFLSQRGDASIIYSNDRAERLIEAGVERHKVVVAKNSIDTNTIANHRKKMNPELRSRILYVGRLISEKKCGLLIEAFSYARSFLDDRDILTYIGEGPMLHSLVEKVEELGILDRVEFIGPLWEEEQLSKYFNESWISVSPGYIGLSAVHSLAYGIPVLVADSEPHSPEIETIVVGKNGYQFSSGSSKDLSEVLVKIRNKPNDICKMSGYAIKMIDTDYGYKDMVDCFVAAVSNETI